MTDWLSPAADAALRSVSVPPVSADFFDRVMARLEARPAPLPDAKAGRDRRGTWKRGWVILMSGIAAGLISVGAAATGLFGDSIRNLPMVGSIVERISPAKTVQMVAKPHAFRAKAPPVAAPVVEPLATVAHEPLPALPGLRHERRREAVAQRIADRIARRDERRAALGLPPRPLALAPQMRERLRAMPPPERATLVQRVREIRAERIASMQEVPQIQSEIGQTERERHATPLAKLPDSPSTVTDIKPAPAIPRERIRERRRVLRERRAAMRVDRPQ